MTCQAPQAPSLAPFRNKAGTAFPLTHTCAPGFPADPVSLHTNTLSPLFPQRASITFTVLVAVAAQPLSLVASRFMVKLPAPFGAKLAFAPLTDRPAAASAAAIGLVFIVVSLLKWCWDGARLAIRSRDYVSVFTSANEITCIFHN
jgi:hypothetical protein